MARDKLPGLVRNATKKFERKTSGKGGVRTERGFTLFSSNEDMNNFIKIIKSLQNLGVLIDSVAETLKHETKKQEAGFFAALLAPLDASVV